MIPGALMAAGPIAQGLFGLVDSLFTSDEERMAAKLKLMQLEQAGELAQVQVNMKEAEHKSVFVAGWRPFIGWVCGLSFAWAFVLQPFLTFLATMANIGFDPSALPVLDLTTMLPVLMGMLGLGAMRTREKEKGVARENDPSVTAGGFSRRAN